MNKCYSLSLSNGIIRNMVVGAHTEVRSLTDRDRWICDQIGPVLRDRGLLFAGIDVIGDFMTEVNVTSPTGIRELDRASDLRIAEQIFDAISSKFRSDHFVRLIAGGSHPLFSTAGFGEYSRNTMKNAPLGAGSQFALASPPDGSSAEIVIVNDPSSFASSGVTPV